jgi:hypothetical protein
MPHALEAEAQPPEVLEEFDAKPKAYRYVLRQSRASEFQS